MLLFTHWQGAGAKGEQRECQHAQEIEIGGRPPDPVADFEEKDFGKHGYKVFTSTRLEIVLKYTSSKFGTAGKRPSWGSASLASTRICNLPPFNCVEMTL